MKAGRRVYLVGMMGAGKTTIGRKLARVLDAEFADIDQDIEAATGVSVVTIFELEGEAGFRERESRALRQRSGLAGATGPLVVATGGGAVLSPVNRAIMGGTGFVAYLHAAPEMLYSRTRNDKSRPLLQVADPLGRIRSLVEKRDPLYREIADIVLESGTGIHNILNALVARLGETTGQNNLNAGENCHDHT